MIWRRRRSEEIKAFDDLIEASSLGSPAAKKIRSLSTDEDMERFRKQLARRHGRAYRWRIGAGFFFLALIMLFFGIGDVLTDQILHASVSGLSAGIYLGAGIMTFKLPRISFAAIYQALIFGLLLQAIRLALRDSWWSAGVEIIAFVLLLNYYRLSRKPKERK